MSSNITKRGKIVGSTAGIFIGFFILYFIAQLLKSEK